MVELIARVEAIFFRSGAEMRRWLERNHDKASELLVGFYRVAAGKPSITWPQSVDEALCFGWIDGIRRGRDAETYTIRFTPRTVRSIWSAANIRRATELSEAGRMHPSGVAAFNRRIESRSRVYSYEQAAQRLPAEYERRFRANKKAWAFFQQQAPWYRRTATYWVISAKRQATKERRLDSLIGYSAQARRIPPLDRG